ncbi:hypothetical protein TrVE_jg8961 [Triparma verrucosa]|uniref:Uncharacterized protein n=1 Tax=Triparma verrucosa TaxID=1606542 RepID=A0A9W6Z5W4_9STRA|nr:hypothetical protein TrVE_jg8961 [Triparma verrucosa]
MTMGLIVGTEVSNLLCAKAPKIMLPPTFQSTTTISTLRGGAVVTQKGPNPAVATYNLYHKHMPHIAKFFIAGFVGNTLFYRIIQMVEPKVAALFPSLGEGNLSSATFLLSYLVEIPFQHVINAALCYTLSSILVNPSDPKQPKKSRYLQTLAYTYAAYVNAMLVTTLVKRGLEEAGIGGQPSFWISVYGVGVFNMFILNRAMK